MSEYQGDSRAGAIAIDNWQRRLDRADELARRFPYSAELMYFYRDIVRFQSRMAGIDLAPLREYIDGDPAGPLGAFLARVIDPPRDPPLSCGVCAGPGTLTHHDPEFPHIELAVCEPCGIYWKRYDLGIDPAVIPEVDDLASVPLDLWAAGQGFRKLAPNLFGL